MGGSIYDRDVGSAPSSGHFYSGGTSSSTAKTAMSNSYAAVDTDPMKKSVKSEKKNPVVIALDVTGSNIEFARIVYDKAPMLHGQIEQQGYLKDFDICFVGVGDAYCDRSPLQVCDFEQGISLDAQLKKLYLEGGGGGQHTETYELAAYYFNKRCAMPNAEMPFFFFIGDEAPYKTVGQDIVKKVLGINLKNEPESAEVFKDLFAKFQNNVFFLQNAYCGDKSDKYNTDKIHDVWAEVFKPYVQNIIPIHEEKSVIDVILGTIAIASKSRDLDAYVKDMKDRGQTISRTAAVGKSLNDLSNALVPVAHGTPAVVAKSNKTSGGKRI